MIKKQLILKAGIKAHAQIEKKAETLKEGTIAHKEWRAGRHINPLYELTVNLATMVIVHKEHYGAPISECHYTQEYFVDAVQAVRALLSCDYGPHGRGILDSILCELLVEAGENP